MENGLNFAGQTVPEDFAERDNGESISAEEYFKSKGLDFSKPGDLIRTYRTGQELSIKQLAKKLSIPHEHVVELEGNHRPLDKAIARKLANAFKRPAKLFLNYLKPAP